MTAPAQTDIPAMAAGRLSCTDFSFPARFEAAVARIAALGISHVVEELDDSWVWRWDPCGSCGRLVRGDAVEGTPPRMEPPYNWDVLQEAHPWTWGKAGVSPFGAHSCVKLGIISVERLGYPLRFVDCPTYPGSRDATCSRYVYKDPSLVPDHVYERIGRKRPDHLGSVGRR